MPVHSLDTGGHVFEFDTCPPGFRAITTTRDVARDDANLPTDGVLAELGRSRDELAWCSQVHGRRILALAAPGAQGEGDALITHRAALVPAIRTADCAPVFLVDAATGAFGLVHAGWRSAAAGIVGDAVRAMTSLYGTDPSTLWAGIGPAIGPSAYQVGRDVFDAFDDRFFTPDGDRWTFDLPAAVEADLRDAGVGDVEPSSACTASEPDRYFSYRVEQTSSRLVSLVFARSANSRS